ncbi:TPA: phage virion morphogenesis protein [Pasteurella multocida]|nr:phage virion morphogenesis protein [Pasteurella multocida]
MLKITLNDNQAIQKLTGIANQLQHPRKLYGLLGETLKKIHAARFETEVDPTGKRWQALSPRTKALKAKRGKSTKILRQDGYLADRTAYNYDDKGVEFGSDAKYARLHQFGGNAGRGKKVKIPARPWLGVNAQDEQKLLKKATALLQRQINQNLK